MISRSINIFSKLPIPGNVKTRLGEKIGMYEAYKVHCELLELTFSRVANSFADINLYLDKIDSHDDFIKKIQRKYRIDNFFKQSMGDLGSRLINCVIEQKNLYDRFVIIGSDCPNIGNNYIEEAFFHLNDNDLVVGPAEDGGYVLIGLSDSHIDLFRGISWSTNVVCQQTLEIANSKQLNVHKLETLWDVDTYNEYKKYKSIFNQELRSL